MYLIYPSCSLKTIVSFGLHIKIAWQKENAFARGDCVPHCASQNDTSAGKFGGAGIGSNS